MSRFGPELEARFAGLDAPEPMALPAPVRATLLALAEREGALPEPVTEYYCRAQPAARIEQLYLRREPLLFHPLELDRLPRLGEALDGVWRELAACGLSAPDLVAADTPAGLVAAAPTAAALQARALFGGAAPILGASPGDHPRLAAAVGRLGADAAFDLHLSGFLVHELCHGGPRAAVEPVPWTLLEAASLHLGFRARPAHYFPEVRGEAVPGVAGFLLVGEVFARRAGRAALYRLSLGAGLSDVFGPGADRLIAAALDDWQRARTAPFVLHALDALVWARRLEAARAGAPLDAAWDTLPWWHEDPTDDDLALLAVGVDALGHHHETEPVFTAVASDPPEERLIVDVVAGTLAALPRRAGVFAEPATWLCPPPIARRLRERGATRVLVEGARRERRAEIVRALGDLVASDAPLPPTAILHVGPRPLLCPLAAGPGRDFVRRAAIAAAHDLGLFAAAGATAAALAAATGTAPRRLRALLDLLVAEHLLVRDGERYVAAAVPSEAGGGWPEIAEVLRRDRPLPADDGAAGYHQHLRVAGRAAADEIARTVPSGGLALDLGCGAGTYGEAYLRASPDARVIFFDRADVLALVPQGAETVAGDLLAGDGPLAEGADVVLLANLLHLHPPAACARLIRRAAASLRPGGRVVVKDLDRATHAGTVFALNMALYTEGGDVHTVDDVCAWLTEAGLVGVEQRPLVSDPDAYLALACSVCDRS